MIIGSPRCALRVNSSMRAFDLGPEMADQALDRPGGGIAERADRVAFHLLGHIEQHVDFALLGFAAHQPLHHAPHPAGAFAARRALAAAFMLVEIGEPRDRLHDVGRLVHHDHGSGAKARLQRRAARRNPSAQSMICSAGTSGTDEPPGMTASRLSQPPRMPPQCLSISSRNGIAHRLFDRARRVHMAGDAEQLRALVVVAPEGREPVSAAPQDGRRNRDRFRHC